MSLLSPRQLSGAAASAAITLIISVPSADAAATWRSTSQSLVTAKCSGSTWTFAGGRRDAGAGQVYTTIRLKNTSGRACAVRGYASVTLLSASRGRLGLVLSDGSATRRVIVPRGGTVHIVIHTSNPGISGAGPCHGPSTTMLLTPPDTRQTLRIRLSGLYLCRNGGSDRPVAAGA